MSDAEAGETLRVCATADVTEGSPHVTEVDETPFAVFYADGEYFVLDNRCPHQGGPLGDGKIEDQCVYCPWHGWQFDLDSGEHVHGKGSAETYPIVVEDGSIYVTL